MDTLSVVGQEMCISGRKRAGLSTKSVGGVDGLGRRGGNRAGLSIEFVRDVDGLGRRGGVRAGLSIESVRTPAFIPMDTYLSLIHI